MLIDTVAAAASVVIALLLSPETKGIELVSDTQVRGAIAAELP
jgi:hypothetical protein